MESNFDSEGYVLLKEMNKSKEDTVRKQGRRREAERRSLLTLALTLLAQVTTEVDNTRPGTGGGGSGPTTSSGDDTTTGTATSTGGETGPSIPNSSVLCVCLVLAVLIPLSLSKAKCY